MPSRRVRNPHRDRLLTQLVVARADVGPFSFATDEALAVARTLEPALVAEVLGAVLAAYEPGRDHALAERAAHVAHELKLAAVVPALIACLERLPAGDPVATVASVSLEVIGRPAVGPLAQAFTRARTPEVRFALGLALTLVPGDDRVRPTLEALLDEDPDLAAQLLGVLGDRRAAPALRAALDRLPLPVPGSAAARDVESVVAVGEAILALGGTLTRAQRARFDRACALVERPEHEEALGLRAHLH